MAASLSTAPCKTPLSPFCLNIFPGVASFQGSKGKVVLPDEEG